MFLPLQEVRRGMGILPEQYNHLLNDGLIDSMRSSRNGQALLAENGIRDLRCSIKRAAGTRFQ